MNNENEITNNLDALIEEQEQIMATKFIHRRKRDSTFIEKWINGVRVETTMMSLNDSRFEMQMQLREGYEVETRNEASRKS